MTHAFDPTILREYDIRGVVGETLHAADAHALGRCFGTVVRRSCGTLDRRPRVAVGYDGRLSSPMLEEALVAGLLASGVDAVRVGLGPTPLLYYAEASAEDVEGGVEVTGSHNPADHNGFKMVLAGAPFHGSAIAGLGRMAAAGDWLEGAGRAETRDVLEGYVERLLQGLAGLDADDLGACRIGWDAGNGAAGPVLELLVARLPGEHHVLYSEVDGRFPNHHPDPTIEANLADLRALVAAKNLDFGVAFDGDGDRIGVVDARGRRLEGDQLLALFAQDVLARRPGATVVGDVKTSQAVFDRIAALGGKPVMAPSGHSLIKSEMKRTGALLGGETSGHVFLADDWYGFDDALYAAVRLIALTRRAGQSVTALADGLPVTVATPELRFAVSDRRKFAVIEEVADRLAGEGAKVVTLDGVRVSTPDGWWLLRASNTQAALTARAESGTQAGLDRLLAALDAHLARSGVARA